MYIFTRARTRCHADTTPRVHSSFLVVTKYYHHHQTAGKKKKKRGKMFPSPSPAPPPASPPPLPPLTPQRQPLGSQGPVPPPPAPPPSPLAPPPRDYRGRKMIARVVLAVITLFVTLVMLEWTKLFYKIHGDNVKAMNKDNVNVSLALF